VTGRPDVVPERVALIDSVDPRRGAPERKKNRKHEEKKQLVMNSRFLVDVPTAKYACICLSSHWM
jgi:hypothetical protein